LTDNQQAQGPGFEFLLFTEEEHMPTLNEVPTLSSQVFEELQMNALRIRPLVCAERLWDRHLTPQDRVRLGDDVQVAYEQFGTRGMWSELRGVTPYRAVLDVAEKLGLLRNEDYKWLLCEIGESVDADEALSVAIAQGDLVLVARPREAYWDGEAISIDWYHHGASWDFLWELGRQAKAGQPIDRFTFGESAHSDVVAKRKYRLTTMSEFPIDLTNSIEIVGRGTQQLMIPRETIRIFELDGLETLREWVP